MNGQELKKRFLPRRRSLTSTAFNVDCDVVHCFTDTCLARGDGAWLGLWWWLGHITDEIIKTSSAKTLLWLAGRAQPCQVREGLIHSLIDWH